MKKSPLIPVLIYILLIGLNGCSGFHLWPFGKGAKDETSQQEPPEEALQKEAISDFRRGRFVLAEELFQKIKDRYPFSPYAPIAELRLADCKYFQGLYEEAIPLYEEFERLHPTNSFVPYAIFQLGTCYYKLTSTPDRDQTFTQKAIETYNRLIRRYPKSPYSFEAERRIKKAKDLLAEHEIVVARWYMRTNQFKQAIYRLDGLIERYPDTPLIDRAKKMRQRALIRMQRLEGAAEKGAAKEDIKEEGKGLWERLWDKIKVW